MLGPFCYAEGMEKNKIKSLKGYYQTSLDGLEGSRLAYSHVWCREASEIILELLAEVENLSEYEYALKWTHVPSGTTGRIGGWGANNAGWGTRNGVSNVLAQQKARDAEGGVADHYTYNIIKRRLPGEIEEGGN